MSFYKNLSIRAKMFSAFLLIVIVIVSSDLLLVGSLDKMFENTDTISKNILPSTKLLAKINAEFMAYRTRQYRHVVVQSTEEKKKVENDMKTAYINFTRMCSDYERLIQSPEEKSKYDEMLQVYNDFIKLEPELIAASHSGDIKTASVVLENKSRKPYFAVKTKIDELIKLNTMLSESKQKQIDEDYSYMNLLIYIVIAICVLMALIMGYLLSLSVNKTIRGVIESIKKVTDEVDRGELAKRMPPVEIAEFAEVPASVNLLIETLLLPISLSADYFEKISVGDIPKNISDNWRGDFAHLKNSINRLIDSQNSIARIAESISRGDLNLKAEQRSDKDILMRSLGNMIDNLNMLGEEVLKLVAAAKLGELEKRGDTGQFQGQYAQIISGINETLDNVINPLNVAADYIHKISEGVLPEKISRTYYGDFNNIKDSINQMIDYLAGFVNDMKHFINEQKTGDLDVFINSENYIGFYNEIAEGANTVVKGHVNNILEILNIVGEYGNGNLVNSLRPLPGKQKIANDMVENIKININKLIEEIKTVSGAVQQGNLNKRGNSNSFEGSFKEIVAGINTTLDAVINPMMVSADFIDKISKGEKIDPITDVYYGDFNILKNNINHSIAIIEGLQSSVINLANSAVKGKLDARADARQYSGGWKGIVDGFNGVLDAVIGPLNVAAEYIDRISKGDMPEIITEEYCGDFNELKNNLNMCIRAIHSMITDTQKLVVAAESGVLNTRADINKHSGAYKSIVGGINATLDAFVKPISEAGHILETMATGDFTVAMVGEYKGDFDFLKTNINQLKESLSTMLKQVSKTVDSVATASEEISASSEILAAASQEQSAQADEVATAVGMMAQTITENASSASKTSEVAQDNGYIAKEGGEIVLQTVAKMKDIAAVVNESVANIEKLGESSRQIGEIISVINDIANQTNLLALNAAIEAARAGEQGKGFSVVADEVRKLAERTASATKTISSMIRSIQSETDNAVLAMSSGNKEVQQGIEFADKAGHSLKLVLSSSEDLTDMISQIAAASEEQSATSEEISKNVVSISKVTADAAQKIEETARTAEELANMTIVLRDIMGQFKVE